MRDGKQLELEPEISEPFRDSGLQEGREMREPGQYWAMVEGSWTVAVFDRYGWTLDGRPVRAEKIGQYVGS